MTNTADSILNALAEPVLESVAGREGDVKKLEIECAMAEAERRNLSLTARRLRVASSPADYVLEELRDITQQKATGTWTNRSKSLSALPVFGTNP